MTKRELIPSVCILFAFLTAVPTTVAADAKGVPCVYITSASCVFSPTNFNTTS